MIGPLSVVNAFKSSLMSFILSNEFSFKEIPITLKELHMFLSVNIDVKVSFVLDHNR